MTLPFPPPGYIPTQSAVSGIEVYMPAPPEAGPQQEVVDFKCPQCGATTAYSVEDGGLTCSHCGYYEAPHKAAIGRGASTPKTVKWLTLAVTFLPAVSTVEGKETQAPVPGSCQAI